MTMTRYKIFSVLLFLVLCLPALGEESGPLKLSLEGQVLREDGSIVGKTNIDVMSMATGALVISTVTGESGYFTADNLTFLPGKYKVTASFLALKGSVVLSITPQDASTTKRVQISIAFPTPESRGQATTPNTASITVFYATDRMRSNQQAGAFGASRANSGQLTYGSAVVSIPRDRRIASIELPSWVYTFVLKRDPDNRFVIEGRKEESEAEFYREIVGRSAKAESHEAFVFIHGYNVAFDDAVYRTAQIAYDLGFRGTPILYSWPSNGSVFDYVRDTNNAEWTVPHLEQFLTDLASHTQLKKVHIIAHSMGNRALVSALSRLAKGKARPEAPYFDQVILAAPDIDAGVFRDLAAGLSSTAARYTLYASSTDKALLLSEQKNGYTRAGDTRSGPVVLKGIDTIDVSGISTDFLGHSYIGDSRSILSDVFTLINKGSPPFERFGIRSVTSGSTAYWRLLQ